MEKRLVEEFEDWGGEGEREGGEERERTVEGVEYQEAE